MERKYANHPGWKRITQRRFYGSYVQTPQFTGHITLFCMDAVLAPLEVEFFGRKTRIVDAGYSWLKHFPSGENFTVTAAFDASGQIVQWYIDICRRMGVDQDQIPWMDDLYLDLVVSPDMQVFVKDADELLAASENGQITMAEFDLAWRVANRLMDQIARGQLALLSLSSVHRQLLLKSQPK